MNLKLTPYFTLIQASWEMDRERILYEKNSYIELQKKGFNYQAIRLEQQGPHII